MIKKCPTCNRTYADAAISFCLADGALLSAPFDARFEPATDFPMTGPATEVLPPPIAPTQPALQAERMATITTALPSPPRPTSADAVPPTANRKWFLVAAVLLVLVLGGGLLIAYRVMVMRRGETAAIPLTTSSPEVIASTQPTPGLAAPTSSAVISPSRGRETAPSPTPLRKADEPTQPTQPTPTPAVPVPSPKSVDYNKVFSGREVDQRAQVLSQPRPAYTEDARKNQVAGKVVLRMVLAASGEVTNITVVSGLPYGLSESAIAAARKIKFTPAMKDGRAVSQSVQVEYQFNLY